MFGKNNGNMASAGAVAYMFHKKGEIVIPKAAATADDLMNIIIEAGGEDEPFDDGENWEILTPPSAYEGMLEALKKASITPASSSMAMVPDTYIKLEGAQAAQMIRLMEALEDNEDVQNAYTRTSISNQKVLEEVAAAGQFSCYRVLSTRLFSLPQKGRPA